jgi:hypothetical protein
MSLVKGSDTLEMPRSLITLMKNLEYSRCRTACSTPPTYWSTGMKYEMFFLSSAGSSRLEQYRT